jgi:hypothetical protein
MSNKRVNGFLQGADGGYSNSRLIADIVILAALAFAEQVLLFRGNAGIMVAASAAGTIFLTIGGASMAFLYVQKKTEDKEIADKPCDDKTAVADDKH